MTNRRIIFAPNVVDGLSGAKAWSCGLSDVEVVGTAERSRNEPFLGAARRRLELHLGGGSRELFVVNHVESIGNALRRRLPTTPHPNLRALNVLFGGMRPAR